MKTYIAMAITSQTQQGTLLGQLEPKSNTRQVNAIESRSGWQVCGTLAKSRTPATLQVLASALPFATIVMPLGDTAIDEEDKLQTSNPIIHT